MRLTVTRCIMEQMPKSPNSLGCFEETAASGSLGIKTSSLHVWPFTCCLLFGAFDLDLAFVSFLKQIFWPYPLTESLCPSCWYRLICFLSCRWDWWQLIFLHTDMLKLPHDPLKVVKLLLFCAKIKRYKFYYFLHLYLSSDQNVWAETFNVL